MTFSGEYRLARVAECRSDGRASLRLFVVPLHDALAVYDKQYAKPDNLGAGDQRNARSKRAVLNVPSSREPKLCGDISGATN